MESTKVPADVSEEETIALNIIHRFPEGLQLTFSDNIAVQHTPSEFTITFAQVKQPLVTTSADYDAMKTITAEVVARIVLTPSKMAEFIQTLQENWGMYQRRMKALVEARKNVGTTDTTPDRPSEN
jgi:hypothetical protein